MGNFENTQEHLRNFLSHLRENFLTNHLFLYLIDSTLFPVMDFSLFKFIRTDSKTDRKEECMNRRLLVAVWTIVGLFLITGVALAAAPFYEGKSIRIIVGYSAGGGYDMYARVLARHMPKHIPGKPTFIVENMTGAGSLIAANHLFKVAKPDGLAIGHFNGGLFFNQVLAQPGIEFDTRKFEFIGAAVKAECAYAFTKASGITNMEKWMTSKTPVKMGGVGPGAYAPDNVIRIAKAALGLPVQMVSGCKGTADIRQAC